MEEVVMIPQDSFNKLSQYYQGQITESALLKQAGRLAAEKEIVLKDKRIPDSLAVQMSKNLAKKKNSLIRQIRTGVSSSTVEDEDPEVAVHTPVENLLRKVVKNTRGGVEDEEEAEEEPPKKKRKKKAKKKTKTISPKLKPSVKKKKPKSKGLPDTPPSDEGEFSATPYTYEETYPHPDLSPPTTRSKTKKKTLEQELLDKWQNWDGDDD